VAADGTRLDEHLAELYARALVAVTRASGEIGTLEGELLAQRIDARTAQPISLEDLLLAETLTSVQLAETVGSPSGPFRSGRVAPAQLAAMIVVDAVAVVLAKGYVAEEEAAQIVRFAQALGCSYADVREMSDHLGPWLPALG
jgi:hypothetical protein